MRLIAITAVILAAVSSVAVFGTLQQRKTDSYSNAYKERTTSLSYLSRKHDLLQTERSNRVAFTQYTALSDSIRDLSDQQLAGRLIMINLPGPVATDTNVAFLRDHSIGGVILMGGNISSPQQLTSLITSYKAAVPDLLVAVDQEGGIVSRIHWEKNAGLSAQVLGTGTPEAAAEVHRQRAKLLSELGVDIVFAPVLDLRLPGSWIGSRSFSDDSSRVSTYAESIVPAIESQGVASAAKHFPGLGRSAEDSHEVLPVIPADRDMLAEDIAPFTAYVKAGGSMIMTGHGLYPALDPDMPASLSSDVVTGLIRKEMGFEGIIVTDDLRMGALDAWPDKSSQALSAGNDMLLYIDYLPDTKRAITSLTEEFSREELEMMVIRLHRKTADLP
ncbi:MAG: putative lipoprotein YbbD precursor [candidate division WS6 bacterium OLB20]|uniref:Putative lipoprotein YbbD n=1 Tax=candidate division WS6 bacterium OLB20 TaxID=1617426 RepID=A0A136LXP9_9BACT|nr:MAG: putative lipoprotein YbbD precursor [candidate division WS6 bacterium OLB20]